MVRRLLGAGAAPERIAPEPQRPAVAPPRAPLPRPPERPRDSPPPAAAPDLEQWFGQRGLLIVGVTLLALRHEIEGLAIWALAGAYLAPILLPPPTPNPEAFLGYLEVIGLGTGLLAYTMSWRRTFVLALAGYFLLAPAGAARLLAGALGCWFLAAGALLTLHVTRRRAWPEARVGMLVLAWVLLAVALADVSGDPEPRLWLAVGAAFAIAALLWWQELDVNRLRAPDEALLFVVNPFVLLGLVAMEDPKLLDREPALLPGLLAAVYLGVGWARRVTPH